MSGDGMVELRASSGDLTELRTSGGGLAELRASSDASIITNDSLIDLHKKFHFLNDVVTAVPKMSDQAGLPPPGYLAICETGLHVSPPVELIEILVWCWMTLSQFSYRSMSVTMGLIALFRDQGAVLTPKHLSQMS
ncbi:hypothetical protein IEQ34_003162 [Dendrobium chrysotoxum]|uniref:Uncharacterized protein n=1 Tax=Dendrobium chrysotoxum TaxID=161865 RepID=A0AAV7HIY5_DENCH|nr:hypothetical protein IEQ34_003162 [Dendrobium chrysotoxum]